MKRVLLTGACGFIGRHCIAPLLERGYAVHAVSSNGTTREMHNVSWHRADILLAGSADALMERVKPTHLLHLAWYTEHGAFWTSPENVRWVEASLALLHAFVRVGGERVVMAGSCAEYDWTEGLCSEATTPLKPRTLYGVCKHSLQLVATAYATQTGLSSAWGRVFFLYGPHERPQRLVSSVVTALLTERAATCSEGNQIRDFLYVQDVASAFAAILDSTVEGPLNVGSGTHVSVRDVVTAIADKLGRRQLVQFNARKSDQNDPPLLIAETRRLRDEVGWCPQFTLSDGLDRTIAWWRDRLQKGAHPSLEASGP